MRRSPIDSSVLAILLLAAGLLAFSPIARVPIVMAQEDEAETVERGVSVGSWLHLRPTAVRMPPTAWTGNGNADDEGMVDFLVATMGWAPTCMKSAATHY